MSCFIIVNINRTTWLTGESEIWPLKIQTLEIRFQMVWLSLLWVWSQPFENQTVQNQDIFSGFQMVFDTIGAICPDFKWLGLLDFRSHSKSGPFATQSLFYRSKSRFQIFTVFVLSVTSEQLKKFIQAGRVRCFLGIPDPLLVSVAASWNKTKKSMSSTAAVVSVGLFVSHFVRFHTMECIKDDFSFLLMTS